MNIYLNSGFGLFVLLMTDFFKLLQTHHFIVITSAAKLSLKIACPMAGGLHSTYRLRSQWLCALAFVITLRLGTCNQLY